GGATACRTSCTRRSAFVNVPSFSRKAEPGRSTCANVEVAFSKRSCTTTSSSERSAASTWCTFGSVCAMASPNTYIARSYASLARDRPVEHLRDHEPALLLDRPSPARLEHRAHRVVRRRAVHRERVRQRAHVARSLHVVLPAQRVHAAAAHAQVAAEDRQVRE